MRLNKFIALATGMGRRPADVAIANGRVEVDGASASTGQNVTENSRVSLDGKLLELRTETTTIMLNKPAGYVVSRSGQGSKTIYELLPEKYQQLKPVGRLDRNSSGLLLLTNDGQLANELTHPSRRKAKVYEVTLDKPLAPLHQQMISDYGIVLEDGPSKFQLEKMSDDQKQWKITMYEGRNRQIRRTFAAIGYTVQTLHRTQFGNYSLGSLGLGAVGQIGLA